MSEVKSHTSLKVLGWQVGNWAMRNPQDTLRQCAFLLVLVLLLIDGCGGGSKPKFTEEELARIPFAQKTGLPEASGGFVLAVGGEIVTSDEIIGSLIEHNGVLVSLKERFRPIA